MNYFPFVTADTLLNTDEKKSQGIQNHRIVIKRHKILQTIKQNPEKTIYFYAKKTDTNYSQMHQIIQGFLFMRLVCVKWGKNSNGELQEVFFIPDLKEVKEND